MLSLDYIAGFVDGEGCITLTKRPKKRKNGAVHVEYQPVLVIANTNKAVLEEIRKVISGSIVTRPNQGNRKRTYALRLGNRQCYKAMADLKDYLLIKRPQALLILRVKEMKSSLGYEVMQRRDTMARLDTMLAKFRGLNRRGVTSIREETAGLEEGTG